MKTELLQPHTSFSTQACRFGAPADTGSCQELTLSAAFLHQHLLLLPAACSSNSQEAFFPFLLLLFNTQILTTRSVLLYMFQFIWIQSDHQFFTSSPSPHSALVLYKNTQSHFKHRKKKKKKEKHIRSLVGLFKLRTAN